MKFSQETKMLAAEFFALCKSVEQEFYALEARASTQSYYQLTVKIVDLRKACIPLRASLLKDRKKQKELTPKGVQPKQLVGLIKKKNDSK